MTTKKKKHRRVGRPRKPGPKKKRRYVSKKPKIDGRTLISHKIPYKYKIVECKKGKEMKLCGKFVDIKDAYIELKNLEKKNDTIIFPKSVSTDNKIEKRRDEYLLLEKNTDGLLKNSLLRDDIGKFSEVKTTNNSWVIIDKIERKVEETFHVFGYDKISDRKNLLWIYENLITLFEDKYELKRLMVYKNKFIIKKDNNTFDIVFCKTESDAIRFYNTISELLRRDKIKNVYLYGSYSELSEKRKILEEQLVKYTGFSLRKIQMNGNSFFTKK